MEKCLQDQILYMQRDNECLNKVENLFNNLA
jgi:hypothetical protein